MTVEFALPERPLKKLTVKARVAWVRAKLERTILFPGMGIQILDVDKGVRDRMVKLVTVLNQRRSST